MKSNQNESKSKMTQEKEGFPWGSALFVFFFFGVAAWIWWQNDLQDKKCPEGFDCLRIGSEFRLKYSGFAKSLNGLSKVKKIKASLKYDSGRTFNVKVSSYKNDDWSKGISTSDVSLYGVSVTDITDVITLHLLFNIPDKANMIDMPASLKVTGKIIYPELNSGDDVVTRSLDNLVNKSSSFSNASKDIDFNFKVLLKPKNFEPADKTSMWFFWIAIILGLFFLAVIFFGDFEDPDEKSMKNQVDEPENEQEELLANNCIKQLMIFMILIDEKVDLEEVAAIQTLYKQLTNREYDASQLNDDIKQLQDDHIKLGNLLDEMNETLSENDKSIAYESAFLIAVADGLLHDEERDMLKFIEIRLLISAEKVQEMCDRFGIKL